MVSLRDVWKKYLGEELGSPIRSLYADRIAADLASRDLGDSCWRVWKLATPFTMALKNIDSHLGLIWRPLRAHRHVLMELRECFWAAPWDRFMQIGEPRYL